MFTLFFNNFFSSRNRYIPALLLIAIFSTLTYTNLSDIILTIKEDSKLINISGRQRMLSQKLVLLTEQYLENNTLENKESLEKNLVLMKDSHLFLAEHLRTNLLNKIYVEDNLNNDVEIFLHEIKQIIKNTDQNKLLKLKIDSQKLLSKLENAVEAFELYSENKVDVLKTKAKEIFVITLIILFIEAFIIFYPASKNIKEMTEQLAKQKKELENNLEKNITLLEQYKDAIDEGTIVSKTDTKGNIIYVNDEFCRISGYSREELINKPHNIVRHPDMPKSAFKEMWETIQNKKLWKGIVYNKAKDGSRYIVYTTIKPIIDSNGVIIEYIGIRQDITEIYQLQEEIIETQREMLERMGELAETRSKETGHHVLRVAKYSALLARYYGFSEEEIKLLQMASPMHDIGKIGIPDDILLKPTKLTTNEFEIMKTHTQIGQALFINSKRELLKAAAIVAYEHHEKWDGTGYPRGLKGEEIHIYGRITALADVFDALGSERVYKKAWDDENIFKYFKEQSGKQFDPKLVEIFFDNIEQFIQIRNEFKDKI